MIAKAWADMIRRARDVLDPKMPADGQPPDSLWPFIRWNMAGGWGVIWIGVAVSIAAGVTETLTMYFLGEIVDAAATHEGAGFMAAHGWTVTMSLLLVLVLRPLFFGGLALNQGVMIGPNMGSLLLIRLHRWTLGQSVTFFDNDFAGRIAQKQMQTSNSLTEVAIESVNAITFGFASIIGSAILLGSINPWLTLILFAWFGLYVVFLRIMLPRIRVRAKARAAARASVTGQVVDTISNIKTVKLFAGSDREDGKAIDSIMALRERATEFGELAVAFRLGLIFLAGCLPAGVLTAAIVLRGTGITPGEIAAAGGMTIRLSQMTGWVSFTLMGIYSHIGEAEDGMRTLARPHALTDTPKAGALQVPKGEVKLDNVTFAYGQKAGGVDKLSLTIKPGEKLGIVGASGAGKSTLVNLILRLYDAEKGQVLIDGTDVSTVAQESLRAQIGMVSQETAMFNRTARDNIAYGRPDATEDQIVEATRRAAAHDFVLELKDHNGNSGYEAFLGERGVKLSGGQRQRIALARALLKDAPILVLDEATSALDSEVEAVIQEALGHAMEGKTVIAIAHRLSTISQMDRIIVMDEGRIVEEGNHEDLLARKGLYARYWNRQSGGFLKTLDAAE